MSERYDVAIVGAGAAGLMAAIFAVRAGARTIVLETAKKIGAKILISGGGRCNVTHDVVRPEDFNGNRNAIAKVLRTLTVDQTIAFFAELGVELNREETGKLFPTTDKAATVLDALLRGAGGAEIRTTHRVTGIAKDADGFRISVSRGDSSPRSSESEHGHGWPRHTGETIVARRIILATGGRSVPKTGSDGAGFGFVTALGHSVTELFPALVPLVLPPEHWLTRLSGTSVDTELAVRNEAGRIVRRERGSMLFTHFGLSGPVVLDISRHWIAARASDSGATLTASLAPDSTFDSLEGSLVEQARRNGRASVSSFLRAFLAERLAQALAVAAGVDPQSPLVRLTREGRRQLVHALVELPLPVIGDRGFDFAEVTAGGVPLSEIELSTMESRVCRGLHLCGEILDVDGRIGGYNFQWAWASGRLAGLAAGTGR